MDQVITASRRDTGMISIKLIAVPLFVTHVHFVEHEHRSLIFFRHRLPGSDRGTIVTIPHWGTINTPINKLHFFFTKFLDNE